MKFMKEEQKLSQKSNRKKVCTEQGKYRRTFGRKI